ncbi:uncharacterized protein LOC111921315 isoform X1 [Lactuca sativa]|uniref:uncharacterized protein LOC111921315 isoform X1 n=1 Tax=Lactuca sativa TaxID=4236 RepID=UPI0022AF2B9F|nr:uncharacterized protein LOC111921315 isoform X1 [Lactuca sativa]
MATTTTTTTTTTGASATVDPDRPPPLPLDSIPIIDLSLLSQSELFSLSMCSNSSFDRNRCDDVVIPKIDRSVFNESAGSRKQTYSRLRLAPAQSSTSTKTTIHRRTPRLRSSHTPAPNNINDAEQAENSQIIRMLKELFKSDHSFGELVPFEVELDTNVVVPESLNPETNRKRGRPRRQDGAVFIDSPDAKRMRNNTVKKVAAYDAVGDIEMVNSRGVKVNLENLGMLEDPYGLEIRRRTEGLSTKDELLGFLGGLNGEWGTSTKKRKVVDASYFGDALPKGWKLSLSIKKRSDLVWLFCRRYISPSGMQFESFKEVSVYLLSLLGEKNLDKPTHTPSNNRDDFGSKGASMNQKDVSVRVDTRKSRPIVLALSSRDFKKEVKSNIVDPINVKVEEFFKCLKCFMIFEGKADLFDHQMLAHKTERSQLDSATSEWTVVKGGIFECQFCNTTFNKRNQYNEHIGTHETNETQTCEASEAPTAEKSVDPVLFTGVPDNVVMETDNAPFGDKLTSASPQSDHKIISATESKVNEHVHDLNILDNDNKGEHVNMNEDVSVEESGGEIKKETVDASFGDKLISVSPQIDQKINSGTESEFNDHVHDELNILDHDNQGEHVNMNEDVSAEESSGEIEKETDDAPFDDKLISASPQSDHKIISGTKSESEFNDDVRDFNMNEDVLVEESGGEIEKKCHEGENEFFERDKSPEVSDSKSDFSLGHEASIDESNGKLESCVVTVDSIDIVEKDIVGISNGEDAHVDENPECILEKGISSENSPLLQSTNELLDSIEKDSVEVLNLADSEIRVQPSSNICEEKGFQENINDTQHLCSPFDELTSEKEELINVNRVAEVNKLFDSETLFLDSSHNTSLKDSPQKLGFDFEEDRFCYGIANSRVEDIGNKSKGEEPETQMIMEEFELENDVNINNVSSLNRSTEVNLDDFQIPSLGSSQNDLNLEFCSLVPTGNQQEFSFQDDDVTGIYENAHEGSERGLLDHFSITETSVSDDIFGNNSSYSTPLDAFKFDEERDIGGAGIHELSLNFGNSSSHGIGLYENTVNLNQKKDDVQTNLTMVNINNEIETQGFAHNNANMVYPQVVANQQQSGNGVFRVDERYNNNNNNNNNNNGFGFNLNGFRSSSSSSRSEPVEFRFLTGRSSQHIMNPHHHHHLQGASSGVFPYNNNNNNNNNTGIIGMDQGYGSGFWSGKNGMGGRNVITGVCAWCRNEFHMQQPEVQGQGGGIGSLCPNCSGQVNML